MQQRASVPTTAYVDFDLSPLTRIRLKSSGSAFNTERNSDGDSFLRADSIGMERDRNLSPAVLRGDLVVEPKDHALDPRSLKRVQNVQEFGTKKFPICCHTPAVRGIFHVLESAVIVKRSEFLDREPGFGVPIDSLFTTAFGIPVFVTHVCARVLWKPSRLHDRRYSPWVPDPC